MGVSTKEWVAHVGNYLYAMEPAAKGLAYAWNSEQNMLLYGRGGYGKSEVATMFGEYLKEKGEINTPVFAMSFSLGTSEDLLYGGVDIKRYKDESELVYNLKRSFIQHEYVIFEEMLDANLETLGVLKDILVSGKVRMGSEDEWHPIKTKMIVACTNKTREEVSLDWTTAAILDRFQMECLVEWSTHTYDDYLSALKLSLLGKTNTYAAQFVSKCAELYGVNNKDQEPVNPRATYFAMRSMIRNGNNHDALNYFPKIRNHVASTVSHMVILRKTSALEGVMNYLQELSSQATQGSTTLFTSTVEDEVVAWVSDIVTNVGTLLRGVSKVTWGDENHNLLNEVKDQSRKTLNTVMQHAQKMILEPEDGSSAWLISNFVPSQVHVLSSSNQIGKPYNALHQAPTNHQVTSMLTEFESL